MRSLTLSPEEISANSTFLTDFFSQAYGERFVGEQNFKVGYLDNADYAITSGPVHRLGAAALLRNARITACATSTDRVAFGSRFDLMTSVLGHAHATELDAWISIGVNSPATMVEATKASGMTRSHDTSKIEERLETFGDVSRYAINQTNEGLLIALNSSAKGPNYWQQVWDWSKS